VVLRRTQAMYRLGSAYRRRFAGLDEAGGDARALWFFSAPGRLGETGAEVRRVPCRSEGGWSLMGQDGPFVQGIHLVSLRWENARTKGPPGFSARVIGHVGVIEERDMTRAAIVSASEGTPLFVPELEVLHDPDIPVQQLDGEPTARRDRLRDRSTFRMQATLSISRFKPPVGRSIL